MQTAADTQLIERAGTLAEPHAMFWIRSLCAPVEQVWPMVSTRTGLERWWIVPPTRFELRKGGRFNHHWNNTIVDFREAEYIDFAENSAEYAGTGGMRFELAAANGSSTRFIFLDTWGRDMTPPAETGGEQPGGPGTPWAGVAAGWHAMVDRLERLFDDAAPAHDYEQLSRFYAQYLTDLYRWRRMVQRTEQNR